MNLRYNSQNFYKNTFCVFESVPNECVHDKKPNFISKSGSRYYYTKEGVYRISTHWGRAATCKWRLAGNDGNFRKSTKTGFAKWSDFYRDNEFEKLYFIRKDTATNRFIYDHKDRKQYHISYTLRTASETRKVIRQLKKITMETAWAKYVPHDNLEHLRNFLVEGLLTTSTTLPQLKAAYTEEFTSAVV